MKNLSEMLEEVARNSSIQVAVALEKGRAHVTDLIDKRTSEEGIKTAKAFELKYELGSVDLPSDPMNGILERTAVLLINKKTQQITSFHIEAGVEVGHESDGIHIKVFCRIAEHEDCKCFSKKGDTSDESLFKAKPEGDYLH